jgi:hypothetical protein
MHPIGIQAADQKALELGIERLQLDARLRAFRARAAVSEQKQRNRKQWLAGRAILSTLENGGDAWSLVAQALLKHALNDADAKALFGLVLDDQLRLTVSSTPDALTLFVRGICPERIPAPHAKANEDAATLSESTGHKSGFKV